MVYLHFSVLASFRTDAWTADIASRVCVSQSGPACCLDTPDRFSSSAARVVQDVCDVFRDQLKLDLLLGMLSLGLLLMIFGLSGVEMMRRVCFGLTLRLEVPLKAGSSAFLGRGLLRIRNRRLGGRAVNGRGSGRLYRVSQGDEVDVHCFPCSFFALPYSP